jgi:hypothetical protein
MEFSLGFFEGRVGGGGDEGDCSSCTISGFCILTCL